MLCDLHIHGVHLCRYGGLVCYDYSLLPQFFENPDLKDGINLSSSDGSWMTVNSSDWLPTNYGTRPFVDVVVSAQVLALAMWQH
jgi:hypothetical protein